MINTIRYMGSKRKLIEKLNQVFDKSSKNIFVDVFSGSGVVALNNNFNKIIANDIQKYSSVIVQGSTKPFSEKIKNKVIENFVNWSEKGFIEKNYVDIFFSLTQAKFLDSLRDLAHKDLLNNELLLYVGIKMMFLMQNSPGHFAAVLKDSERSRKLLSQDPVKVLNNIFDKWEYVDKKIVTRNLESIESIDRENALYYMDPPYTTDQYSRFYHLLESFVSDFDPELNDNKAKYAAKRYKSLFSNKKTALEEFKKHINKARKLHSDVVISYFTNGVVSESDILELIKEKYSNYNMEYVEYSHSSLGGKPKKAREIIMWGFYE